MARHMTVSILGSASLHAPTLDEHQTWTRLRDAWMTRLDRIAADKPDLVVLPEYCGSLFIHAPNTPKPYHSPHNEKLIPFFQQQARRLNTLLSFTLVRRDPQGRLRNTMFLLGRDGTILGTYNKVHPTETELQRGITPGAPAIIETELGKIACGICFDLNFDELWQTCASAKPDLVLFPSVFHGGMMQAYRAYQCRAHFISAIGGSVFKPSHIIAPNGRILASTTHYHDFVTARINLDCRLVHLDYHADKLQQLKAALGQAVQIDDIDHLGSVLVTSEDPAQHIDQLLPRFDIIDLDTYLARARMAQAQSKTNRASDISAAS